MPHRNHSRPRGLALLVLAPWLAAGCGAGTAAIVAGASGSSGGGNSAPSIANLQVPVFKTSPARIRFELSDREGESVRVELCARVPLSGSGLSDPQVLTRVSGPGFPANGSVVAIPAGNQVVAVDADWFFPEESFPQWPDDGRYVPELQLIARLSNGAELVLGDDEPLSIGNDAPQVTDATPIVPVEAGEVSGIARIQVTVEDSSDDVVSVLAEYDVQGDDPDETWQPATGFGLSDVRVSSEGTTLDFFWETDTDLRDLERQVTLRFTATDDAPASGDPGESAQFRVDNNATPIVQLDTGLLGLNPDERRGIPIPYRVIDEEGDEVEVILQWRREGEEFPELPRDMAALDAILADPVLRRENRVCTPYPHHARGLVVPIDGSTVRLPELASSQSWILASGLEGRTLELLRPSSIPEEPRWSTNPLSTPIVALSIGDGRTALVLDLPGNGCLREIELASGAVVREIAQLGQGIPSAMALEHGGAAVLVALEDAGTWRIARAELEIGAITELLVSDGSEPAPVRGIASLGTNALVFTAGSSLFQLDYTAAPRRGKLLTGLATPWGVVVDPQQPHRIYVSEREADRVLTIELDAHAELATVVKTETLQPGRLEEPEALALERNGARMLVVTTGPGGGHRILGLDLGARGGNVSFPIGVETSAAVTSLATGPDGLRLACLPTMLLVAGGVEQRRVIATHAPSTHDVSVDPAFDPAPIPGQPWRVSGGSQSVLRASAQGVARSFLWDSADASSGLVSLRATAHDEEFADPADGVTPKQVRAALEVDPLTLDDGPDDPNWPFAVLAADLDGDGDLDLVSANLGGAHTVGEPDCIEPGGDNLSVFFQNAPGSYGTPPLYLGSSLTTDGPRGIAAADLDGDGALDLVSANYCGGDLAVFFQDPLLPGSFAPVLTLDAATTDGPAAVAAADLDGNGTLDLVSANLDSSNLTVFFQDAPRSFARTHTLGGPGITDQPASVATGDLDGDGDLDLVCANSFGGPSGPGPFDGNLTIFFQNPSSPGGFTGALRRGDSETMKSPRSVAAADLDGDGDLDLVSANRRGHDLTVFFQLSPGAFETTPHPLGGPGFTSQPFAVTAADLDGDGDLDILSANASSDSLTVFFQDTPGSFEGPPLVLGSPTTTYTVASVAVADLDGDGDLDLVSANDRNEGVGNLGGPGNLTVFLQFTPGSFAAAPLTLGGVGRTSLPSSPTAADLDGDGDLDLVSANRGEHTLIVFSQLSPGRFTATPLSIGDPGTMVGPFSIAAADLDGDGHQDLVSANLVSDNLTVFFQDPSSGSFAAPSLALTSADLNFPRSVEVVDLDRDGALDLVSANLDSDNLTVFFLDARPSFTLSDPATDGAAWVVAADLDADGNQDLVSANADRNRLAVFFQDLPGSFATPPLPLGNFATRRPLSVAVADLDGDGDQDLVSANSDSNNLTTFFQGPARSFQGPTVIGGPATTSTPISVAVADLDGDGDQDLAAAIRGSLDLRVFFQLSPGSFGATPLVLDSGGGEPSSVSAADLDGDGDQDLVLANWGTTSTRGNLRVFFGGH